MNAIRYGVLVACAMMSGTLFPVRGQSYPMPMDRLPLLSSNFAEMRATHLHSGIDIKTGGVEGKEVKSVADGYICRIGIKPYGYGRVLYVAHPDGHTTVYGHLSRFSPRIETYVRERREALKRHSVDLFPKKNEFPVKAGEVIAWSGNSGRSFGPHLHFEVRETATQRVLNPVSGGFIRTRDTIPPRILSVGYYEVDTVSGVPFRQLAGRMETVRHSSGRYGLVRSFSVSRPGYFVVEVTDRKNGTNNTMGIYRIMAKVDGETVFDLKMDGFSFDEGRYVSSVAEYALQRGSRNEIFRLIRQKGNRFPGYGDTPQGILIQPDRVREMEIIVVDDCSNISTLRFALEYVPRENGGQVVVPVYSDILDCRRDYVRTTGNLTVRIPAGALYESLFYRQGKADIAPVADIGTVVLSDCYRVHEEDVPLFSAAEVSVSVAIPDSLRQHVMVARVGSDGRLSPVGGHWEVDAVRSRIGSFGTYCVVADLMAPEIHPSFAPGADLSRYRSISFMLKDNFSGIATFDLMIDGKWAILEHNVMKGSVTHYFDDSLASDGRAHKLRLVVKDGVGNVSAFECEFIR